MPQYSINQLLEMEKRLKERKNELTTMRQQSQISTSTTFNGSTVVQESKYDVVDVDTKIVEISESLFEIGHKIKEINAITKIDVNMDFKNLMAPLKKAEKED